MSLTPRTISTALDDALDRDDLLAVPWAADPANRATVLAWLLDSAALGTMSGASYRRPDTSAIDAYFGAGIWAARAFSAYMRLRHIATTGERQTLDAWFEANARWFAAHVDHDYYGIRSCFPNRERGDYSVTASFASTGAMMGRNAHQTGPALSVLSQLFNNRRSNSLLLPLMYGVYANDAALMASVKRYVKEWVTYSCYADGSQGEWYRNGDYGYVTAGVIYGASNIFLAKAAQAWLPLRGDTELSTWSTEAGLWGTASPGTPRNVDTALLAWNDMLSGARTFRDEAGALFDQPYNSIYGWTRHSAWMYPFTQGDSRFGWINTYATATPPTPYEDPYGLHRGQAGLFIDTRTETAEPVTATGTGIVYKNGTPPSLVAVGDVNSGTGAVAYARPSTVPRSEQDLWLLVVADANGGVSTTPSGWTAVSGGATGTGTANSTTATGIRAYWRWGGTDSPSVADLGDHQVGRLFQIKNANRTTPIAVVATGLEASASTTMVFPGVTTSSPNHLVLSFCTTVLDSAAQPHTGLLVHSGLAGANTGFFASTQGNGSGASYLSGIQVISGATGDGSGTLVTASQQARLTIAIAPLADTGLVEATQAAAFAVVGGSGSQIDVTQAAAFVVVAGDIVQVLATQMAAFVVIQDNAAPIARDDTFLTQPGAPLDFTAAQLLVNDSDENEEDSLSVTGVGAPGSGTITSLGGGSYRFTPATGFTGTTSATYSISDGAGGAASATIYFIVAPDRPPRRIHPIWNRTL